jgi:hypothetical protein
MVFVETKQYVSTYLYGQSRCMDMPGFLQNNMYTDNLV